MHLYNTISVQLEYNIILTVMATQCYAAAHAKHSTPSSADSKLNISLRHVEQAVSYYNSNSVTQRAQLVGRYGRSEWCYSFFVVSSYLTMSGN